MILLELLFFRTVLELEREKIILENDIIRIIVKGNYYYFDDDENYVLVELKIFRTILELENLMNVSKYQK